MNLLQTFFQTFHELNHLSLITKNNMSLSNSLSDLQRSPSPQKCFKVVCGKYECLGIKNRQQAGVNYHSSSICLFSAIFTPGLAQKILMIIFLSASFFIFEGFLKKCEDLKNSETFVAWSTIISRQFIWISPLWWPAYDSWRF